LFSIKGKTDQKGPLKTSRTFYAALIAVVLLSVVAWFQFSYPRFATIDLAVNRAQALEIARTHLRTFAQADPDQYISAIIFSFDSTADRYLQKAIGFQKEEEFIAEHNLDLYVWLVRFMKEGEKGEYRIAVSSNTGEVISFGRQLEDSAARSLLDEKAAQKRAEEFLKERFRLDFNNYTFYSKSLGKFDNRIEYNFYWEKKGVFIPWSTDLNSGGARLLTGVALSGDEVLNFSKQILSVPDQFTRDIELKKESGRNLSLLSEILSLLFFVGAIWIVVMRRNHLAMNATKRFYIWITVFLFALTIASGLNNAQGYIYGYPTTQPFTAYILREIIFEILNRFFWIACFVIPCLAGELVRFEALPKKPQAGLFHYVTTTFFSRNVAGVIVLGYAFAMVMIGFQAVIFDFGFKHLGVWVEQTRLSQLSSGYFPFLAAFAIGIQASLTEETLYRMFGISFAAKIFKNLLVAVLISSLVWGLGHTGYMVFPFWFRGLEVTLLGLFTAWVYLRFGLICVIVQHFLFDAFWAGSPYIFGNSDLFNFVMSIVVLALPFVFAAVAYVRNRPVVVRSVEWRLNPAQRFNLEILKGYLLRRRAEPGFEAAGLRQDLIKNGWDIAIIDVAFKQLEIPVLGDNYTQEG
jgi:membrane protease YdiL (CAAX protease family)